MPCSPIFLETEKHVAYLDRFARPQKNGYMVARENDLRERIPIHASLLMKTISNLFFVLCHTAWLF